MGDISRKIICSNCNLCDESKVIAEGIDQNGVMYYVTKPTETYIIDEHYIPSESIIKKSIIDIANYYIPHIGKYELEYFVAKELMTAIYVTRDLSNLFSTTAMIDSITGASCYISKEKLKESLLPLFEIKRFNNVFKCTFKEKTIK